MITAKMDETVLATPALVKRFTQDLAVLDVDSQRFNPRRVHWLLEQLELGLLRAPEWIEAYCKADHKTYRINGQHTSKVFAERNGSIPKGFKVKLVKYVVDTFDEICELYSKIDNLRSARSNGEVALSHACAVGLGEIRKMYLTRINGGVAYSYKLFGGQHLKTGDQQKLVREHPAFYQWASKFVAKPWLGIKAVVAAMFVTHNRSKAAATEFWVMVLEQDAAPDHPSRVLANFLLTKRPSQVADTPSEGDRLFFAKCMHAWNAYRNGRRTTLAYHKDAPLPVAD